MATSRRDHLVETALRLFRREGFHATGIDRILGEAGVAKMTLYKHFSSKDDLILAALELQDRQWLERFRSGLERRAKSPRERLLAVFDVLRDWFAAPDFRGCVFINAASEFAGLDERIAAASAQHKRSVRHELRKLAEAAGATGPDTLADQLLMLMEGAIVRAQAEEDPDVVIPAREAARLLIDAAIPVEGRSPRRNQGAP